MIYRASPDSTWLKDFCRESNKIEGIPYEATGIVEYQAHADFLDLKELTIPDLEWFVQTVQPNARLRDKVGWDVQVGSYFPPLGGPHIAFSLKQILTVMTLQHPFRVHQDYEHLHPFTDGNGRSGRALWLWQVYNDQKHSRLLKQVQRIGFLHTWYYSSLDTWQKAL